jgi:Mob1/phocein family
MGLSQSVVRNMLVRLCLLAQRTFTCFLSCFRTRSSCPRSLNYTWTNQGGKQIALSAPTYIDSVMSSIQNLLDDENVFPTKSSTFPNLSSHSFITHKPWPSRSSLSSILPRNCQARLQATSPRLRTYILCALPTDLASAL